MKLTAKAKRLLLRAADGIEAEPKLYNQSQFAGGDPATVCTSASCLSGWMVFFGDRKEFKRLAENRFSATAEDWLRATKEVLGMKFPSSLFDSSVEDWPEKYRRRYLKSKTQRGRANAAAAMLREIVATDGKLLDGVPNLF